MTVTANTIAHTRAWTRRARLGLAALGAGLAILSAPSALAEPTPAPDTPAPTPTVSVDPAGALPAATGSTELADGMPHLPSPDNLPPGTTDTPPETRNLGYLRDIWHAIRTRDVTVSDAWLLLAQRPMTATASPGQSAAPSGPVGSSATASAVPEAGTPDSPPTP